MTQSVKLVSVASAVPHYILEQRDVAAAAHRAFALRYTDFERLARVFKTSGIRRRYAPHRRTMRRRQYLPWSRGRAGKRSCRFRLRP